MVLRHIGKLFRSISNEKFNSAQLKREIDDKINKLFKVYQQTNKSQKPTIKKKQKPNMVKSLVTEPPPDWDGRFF